MIARGIFFFACVAAYLIPLICMTYVGIRARRSKAYADETGFRTKGDMQEFTLYSLVPLVNIVFVYVYVKERIRIRTRDNTPLHKG